MYLALLSSSPMYLDLYKLRELPFQAAPDPSFLYLNDAWRRDVEAIQACVADRRGFVAVVGEPGTGKTTLLRHIVDAMSSDVCTVELGEPVAKFEDLLARLLADLGVPEDEGGAEATALGPVVQVQRLCAFLAEHTRNHGNALLVVDDAHALRADVLDEIGGLANLVAGGQPMLQVVLAGGPDLETALRHPRLQRLRERITLDVKLEPLAPPDVRGYMQRRLEQAGATSPAPLSAEAVERVATLSRGVPAVINQLSHAALVLGHELGLRPVTAATVDVAWHQMDAGPRSRASSPAAWRPLPTAGPAEVPEAATRTAPLPEPHPAPAVTRTEGTVVWWPEWASSDASVAAGVALLLAMALGIAAGTSSPPAADVARTAPPAPVVRGEPGSTGGPEVLAVAVAPSEAYASNQPPDVSAFEAASVVDAFRQAYQARDVDRLVALFAPDATENGKRGQEAIVASFRQRLKGLDDVRFDVPEFAVAPRGSRLTVRAPFQVSYRRAGRGAGELRGTAEWAVERRDGRPVIVAFDYRVEPAGGRAAD